MKTPSKKTILFVDFQIAQTLASNFSFSDLVPSVYKMICNISVSPESLKLLIPRLISTIDFEVFQIMINHPISFYDNQIKVIKSYSDYPIENIIDHSNYDQSYDIKIHSYFHLVLPPLNCLNFQIQCDSSFSFVIERLTKYFKQINFQNFKTFFFGDFSSKIASALNQTKNPDNALILIDRIKFPLPLFYETDSFFDQVAKNDFSVVFRDLTLLSKEIENGSDNLLSVVKQVIKSKNNSLFKHFSSLSPQDIENISIDHPSIPTYFSNFSSNKHFQDHVTQGAPIQEIIEGVDLQEGLKLFWLSSNLFSPISTSEIFKTFDNIPYSKKYLELIFQNCGLSSKSNLLNHDSLVSFIQSIVDPNQNPHSNLQATGSGIFSKFMGIEKITQYKSILIFILGGISFSEIHSIYSRFKNLDLHKNFIIVSDTICSSFDPFDKKF